MKKKVFLTGMLTVSLLMPVSEAKAQGWPTFDVAKLASLITNLIGRFQPVPQVLSRVNQVKTTISQIQAVGQAAVSGDLKAIGQAASSALQSGAFTGGKKSLFSDSAQGDSGATNASKEIEKTLFPPKQEEVTMEEIREADQIKQGMKDAARAEVLSTALYMVFNAPQQSLERFEKADKAMKEAETVQDAINANTMMIMNGNYERLNQIALKLASLKNQTANLINTFPYGSFKKPEPLKNAKLGDGVYSVQEKDEIDVDFE